ncbi:MAG TPA: hypothetical protein VHY36_06285 [Steroidobacteraceae bacterium]|jgi:hypothetical protein|nr:hypothetical protein [Steroidobacteraceae bacterium]
MSYPGTDDDIERIARGLIDRTLPKSGWTHAAHFAAALWLLRHRGDAAFHDMPPLIRAYNESTGVANTDTSGYHETITVASLRLARAWLAARPDLALHAALAELLASPYGRADWLFAHWSRERLFSAIARRAWVDPDLQAFTC